MSTTTAPTAEASTSMRVRIQRFGTFLSNMVMPNIAAFIAWGLITALFIEVGWITLIGDAIGYEGGYGPIESLGGWGDAEGPGLVGPMITYLLPLLIAYTGGKMLHGVRGGVVGAIATMGVIVGTDIPMFMGAMIMGPLGGWTQRLIDDRVHHRIRPGFEMLVNNFTAGIWGMVLTIFGFFAMGPVVSAFSTAAGNAVEVLVNNGLLPLTSILIEPAKVLFLNNAINHGVLTPLGTVEAAEFGDSILFLLEANPGPGLGLLLAYMVAGRGEAKASAPGAAIIHFIGGIHEIYFPYVLMRPRLIVAMIAGGMTQIFVNVLFDTGLRAPAAPGSIIAVYAQTATDSYLGVTLSVIAGAAVSFFIAFLMLRAASDAADDLAAATASMESMKGRKSSAVAALAAGSLRSAAGPIHSIVFACDAGMGSSAMGASVLRGKVHGAGHTDVTVVNRAISDLADEYDLVVTHTDLTDRARERTPSARHVSVDNFMGSPRYDEIVALIDETNGDGDAAVVDLAEEDVPVAGVDDADVLRLASIVLDGTARTQAEAIDEAGRLLVESGAVDEAYVTAMHAREQSVSTFMGEGLAIPHGTNEAKSSVHRTAMSFVRYGDGIDWDGDEVSFVIGIAGAGDDHLGLLQKVALVFLDADQTARLREATSPDEVQRVLGGVAVG